MTRAYMINTRRPDVDRLRLTVKELMDLEPDEHLSDNPKYRGLKYISLSTYARDQLVARIQECIKWVESPQDVPLMVGKGFRTR